jgi:hypothetical protein
MVALKRQRAITNNIGVYEEIFSSNNIRFFKTNTLFYNLQKALPLMSNIVTRSRGWQPDVHFQQIDTAAINAGWDSWSIKDSFSVLNLSQFGFTRLIDATWIYLEGNSFKRSDTSTSLRWDLIKGRRELAAWRLAWNKNESGGNVADLIFADRLVDTPRMHFIAGYAGESLVAGCILNRTEPVFGISNFFAAEDSAGTWSGMIEFIRASITSNDLVGYEQAPVIDRSLVGLGFEKVGDLTVWIKKSA